MNYPRSAAENVLIEIRMKSPKVQTLIGTGAGLVAAIGFFIVFFCGFVFLILNFYIFTCCTASIRIAGTIALFVGAVMLIMSLTTDFVYIPNVNFNFNFNFVNSFFQSNGPLATGFIAGYLIGFAMI